MGTLGPARGAVTRCLAARFDRRTGGTAWERPCCFALDCLLVLGIVSFAVDRRAAHFFYDTIHRRWDLRIRRTTDWAKGAYWLAGAAGLYVAAQATVG